MAEKFTDLHLALCGDPDIGPRIGTPDLSAWGILRWLDGHQEQLPTRRLDLAEQDQIDAWHQVAKHPALAVCYRSMREGQTFLDRVLERLTELEEAVPMTVTESQVQDAYDIISSRGSFASYREFLFGLGFCIEQDPKPPNAEKLEKIIWDLDGPFASIGQNRAERLAKWLDEAGVKAPDDADGN